MILNEGNAAGNDRKPPKQRHISVFPYWWAKVRLALGLEGAAAYISVLHGYYAHAGQLPDNDKLLAELAGLSAKRWLPLREKLLAHGIARVESGLWVDDAHLYSISQQLKTSQRQSGIAKDREDRKREQRLRLLGGRQ